MTKKEYMKKLMIQKFIGVAILLACVVIVKIAMTGLTAADRDATAILLFVPLGFYMIFSRQILID